MEDDDDDEEEETTTTTTTTTTRRRRRRRRRNVREDCVSRSPVRGVDVRSRPGRAIGADRAAGVALLMIRRERDASWTRETDGSVRFFLSAPLT